MLEIFATVRDILWGVDSIRVSLQEISCVSSNAIASSCARSAIPFAAIAPGWTTSCFDERKWDNFASRFNVCESNPLQQFRCSAVRLCRLMQLIQMVIEKNGYLCLEREPFQYRPVLATTC